MTHSSRLLTSLLLLPLLAAAPASQPADTTLDDAPVGSKWKGKRNHDHKDWDCTATVKSHEDNILVLVTKDNGPNGAKIEWTFVITGNRLRLTDLSELSNTAGHRYEENGAAESRTTKSASNTATPATTAKRKTSPSKAKSSSSASTKNDALTPAPGTPHLLRPATQHCALATSVYLPSRFFHFSYAVVR